MATPLLHLLHLVSPALPIGAYAYSQGLESAIDQSWLKDNNALTNWLTEVLLNGVARLDAPVMLRCYQAIKNQDWDSVRYWNEWILACRETRELLLEDQQLGLALKRLLNSLNVAQSDHPVFAGDSSYAAQFALAAQHWAVSKEDAATGLCWSWLENQVAAATKIVPLGQTQAQKILAEVMEHVPKASNIALTIADDDMGVSLPGVAMASAQHEHQYSRLFRS